MPDLAAALDLLVPAALYRGSLTDNTQDSYDSLVWEDSRPKPTYDAVLEADGDITKKYLKAYAADARWNRQAGGFTYRGVKYDTDFQSPTAFVTAYAMAQANPNYSTQWKTYAGTFVSLTSSDIIGLVEAVQRFTDACYAAEAQCVTGIDNETITDNNQIVAIINAVPNSL